MRRLRRLPRLPRGASRRVRAALRHAADQRHGVLPRPARLGPRARRGAARAPGRQAARRAGPRLERRLRDRGGGIHGSDAPRRGPRRGRVPRAREDLRDGHRRDRAHGGAAGGVHAQAARGGAGRAAREVLRALRPAHGLPQGPPAHRHLRPQQPRVRRADLADRPADLPQHADVLHRGGAEQHPAPLPLRAPRARRADARQVGDDDLPPGPLRAGRSQPPDLREGPARGVAPEPSRRPRGRRPAGAGARRRRPDRAGTRHSTSGRWPT